MEFAHNPVFKEASPDDVKLGSQALRDLDQILLLSTQALNSTAKFTKEGP